MCAWPRACPRPPHGCACVHNHLPFPTTITWTCAWPPACPLPHHMDCVDMCIATCSSFLHSHAHAHVKDGGYELEHDGRLVTVFSAPNYCDQ
eukprot:scaffold39787_cov21-Tisochrysis_lutea.AAC.5